MQEDNNEEDVDYMSDVNYKKKYDSYRIKNGSKLSENNYKVCKLILDLSDSYDKLVRKKKAA